MKTITTLSFLFCILCYSTFSQNPVHSNQLNSSNYPSPPYPELFRSIPPLDATTPEWAALMYSKDPNVFQVDDLYLQYYRKNKFVKTLHTQNYKYWRRQVEPHLNQNGYYRPPTPQEENKQFKRIKEQKAKLESKKNMNNWVSLGPFETYKLGTQTPYSNQVNVYCIDQSASNPNLLYCGTEGGGVYKTTDKGLNWTLTSQDEEFVKGISAIKIHPTNSNIVYTTGNDRIYRTTDGGATWSEVYWMGGDGYEIKFKPDNPDVIICAASNGLYRSVNGGNNWNIVFFDKTWDVDFHPNDPDSVFILKENAAQVRAEFFMSSDGGATWTIKTNGWYAPADPGNASAAGGKIAIPPGDPDRIYACLIGASKAGDDGWIGVYRSNDRGENWTNPVGQDGGPYMPVNTMPWNVAAYSDGYHQGFYNFDMEASHNDPNVIWIGTIRLSESADGAMNFEAIGAANSQRLQDIHADIQDIEVIGDDIWVASDGGVNYSTDELQSHTSRKKGITGSDFWGFGSGWNQDALVGGRYHNGNHGYYQTYGFGNSHKIGGVEESTGYVHPMDGRRAMFSQNWTNETVVRLMPESLGGNATNLPGIQILPNEHYIESFSSGIYFDPRYANHLYVGEGSKIWKSRDGGSSFTELHEFGASGRTLEIAISRSNPDSLYLVFKPDGTNARDIYRTHDGGTTWVQLTAVPANNRNKLEITVNPKNAKEIWVCANDGANGNKVYQSTDGGNTWNNRTTAALDWEHPKDILFQGGTNDVVYLATNNTVFYWDANTQDWINYGTGLPLIINPLQMRPFYRDKKLRIATGGRGIWEASLAVASAPVAQPITYADTLYCSRDTAYFDCYSMLDHTGASWQWTFTPAPQYVSSTTARNPKVVFGANGSYTVSLTVTDGNSNSDTKTIDNMVTVNSQCEPETVPGNALQLQNYGDWAQTSPINMTTSVLTISAWIKPNGIQDEYASIVMNDDESAGLNFRENNNTLAYHWPGGAWWWDSGLEVPAGEWSHVALVVTPTEATVYLNGIGATNTRTLDPAMLTTMKIGSYKSWNGRNVFAEIDEVAIWKKALTQEDVRELMHLTLDGQANDPDLLLYYQFNEPGGQALNRMSAPIHANLAGGATRVTSNAPVGGGTSERMTVNAGGVYTFNNTGIKLGFPTGGTYPDGELATYRLNLEPDQSPSTDSLVSRGYWIIRNFGMNNNFTALDSIVFQDVNPLGAIGPATVNLFKRNSNAFGATWGAAMDQADLLYLTGPVTGNITFGASNGITSFSQIALTRPPVFCPGLAIGSPSNMDVLDNGCTDLSDNVQWYFNWNTCPNTTAYHLEVRQDGAQTPAVDDSNITANGFTYNELKNYPVTTNWKVKVRAFSDGLWTPFSPEKTFNLEAVDTDCTNPCAGTNLVLDDTPIVPNEYRVSQTIHSQGAVEGATSVLFQAVDAVNLGFDFEVKQGGELLILMNGCN